MYRVSQTASTEEAEIVGFLEIRGLVENATLIREICQKLTLSFDRTEDLPAMPIACRLGSELVGAALPSSDRPARSERSRISSPPSEARVAPTARLCNPITLNRG
jgi:hypothetical protein